MTNSIIDFKNSKKHFLEAWKRIESGNRHFPDVIKNLDYELYFDEYVERLVYCVNNNLYEPKKSVTITSPKSKGLHRPVALLYIEDALLFDFLVNQLLKVLEPLLLKGVQDHRLNDNLESPDFKSWYIEWESFQRILRQNVLNTSNCMVLTDITSYYDSIDHLRLRSMLLEHGSTEQRPFIFLIMNMLERWVHRPEYSLNSLRGLPQFDLESLRFLATFYLHEHDERIAQDGNIWFRWLDDMFVFADSTENAMNAINHINSSVRDLSLTLNSGKTEIVENSNVFSVLSFDYFDKCQFFSKEERRTRNNSAQRTILNDQLKDSFNRFYYSEKSRNWIKILKSYYTLFRRYENNYLNNFLLDDLIAFPIINDGIFDYLLHLRNNELFIPKILEYIFNNKDICDENILHGLRYLLKYRIINTDDIILEYACGSMYGNNNQQYNDIIRCMLSLIIAKYGKASDICEMINYYNNNYSTNYQLWRYMNWVGLLINDRKEYEELKLRTSYDGSVQVARLMRYIKQLSSYCGNIDERVLATINNSKLINPSINYISIETYILIKVLLEKKENHLQLANRINNILENNEDIIMSKKLLYMMNSEKYRNDYDKKMMEELTAGECNPS